MLHIFVDSPKIIIIIVIIIIIIVIIIIIITSSRLGGRSGVCLYRRGNLYPHVLLLGSWIPDDRIPDPRPQDPGSQAAGSGFGIPK